MSAQFIMLGIMLIALIFLLLWFIPSQLYRQSRKMLKVSEEVLDLRNLVLDVIKAQELVSKRQQHLVNSLVSSQKSTEPSQAHVGPRVEDLQSIEQRITELQAQITAELNARMQTERISMAQDSESWGYLLSLLEHMQERMGILAQEHNAHVNQKNEQLTNTLKHELQQLQLLSESIVSLHQRLQHSLITMDSPAQKGRSRITTPLEGFPMRHN